MNALTTRISAALVTGLLMIGLTACGGNSGEDDGQADESKAARPEPSGALLDPSLANESAPDEFRVEFETTKGNFTVKCNRKWSPNGAKRFYNLVKIGFFDDQAFFRVLKDFMCQFGVPGQSAVAKAWMRATILDDPQSKSNRRGYLTFAKQNPPNTRSTQLFINYNNNTNLDLQGFTPFGAVEGDGMKVLDALYGGYGEMQMGGQNPNGVNVGQLVEDGDVYLQKNFPLLDRIKRVTLIE